MQISHELFTWLATWDFGADSHNNHVIFSCDYHKKLVKFSHDCHVNFTLQCLLGDLY